MALDKLLTNILSRRGSVLVNSAVRTLIQPVPGAAPRRRGISARLIETILLRVATKSVPGAIIIGGGLLARHLHERKQAKRRLTKK
jgi:hypothetical protein